MTRCPSTTLPATLVNARCLGVERHFTTRREVVAAVQATPSSSTARRPRTRSVRWSRRPPSRRGADRLPGVLHPRLSGLGLAHPRLEGRRVRAAPLRAGGDRPRPDPAADRGGGRGGEGVRRDRRDRDRRRHALQHPALPGPGRSAAAATPQAHAHRRGAHGLGHGRRFRARCREHTVRCRRRVALLGELHAAGPGRDLRAALRHLPRPDLGHQRHVGGHAAAHREGGQAVVIGVAPLLRGSDVPEELRGTLYGPETTGCRAAHHDRRTGRRGDRRAGRGA